MKIQSIEIIYTMENGTKLKASIGRNWAQWGGSREELAEILPLTEAINEVVNNYSEYFTDEESE